MREKRKRKDVADFQVHFMDNILELHQDLLEKTYRHGAYQAFKINDPKPRDIHKAKVRDRLVHHAIYRILYPYFDRKFIFDSYSCRLNKGTHKSMRRFLDFGRKVSRNNTRTCWILKCDIRKFFANIDHEILMEIIFKNLHKNGAQLRFRVQLRESNDDENIFWLLENIIDSFHEKGKIGVGLPLGNLTSQLLVNIYMNEFDQFIKRNLKMKYYMRYADDFVIFSEDMGLLENLIIKIQVFLGEKLKLELHPNKVSIGTFSSGVDFLGLVHFSNHSVLRTSTKRRMLKKIIQRKRELICGEIDEKTFNQVVQSYLGILRHCRGHGIEKKISDICLL